MNSAFDAQTLIRLFGPLEKYECITTFSGEAGFSVQREYPNNVRYHPAKTKLGKTNNVVLIRVVCDYNTPVSTDDWIPLRFDVVNYDRYLAGHPTYNQQDNDSPNYEESEKSKNSRKPINFYGLYPDCYIKEGAIIVDRYSKTINGYSILNELFERHCNLLRFGLYFKQGLFSARKSFHQSCILVIKHFFYIISVKQLVIDNKIYSTHYELSDLDAKNKIGFKGLDFTPVVIAILAVFCIAVFILKDQNMIVKSLFGNNIIIYSVLIILFVVMRYMLPNILVCLLNATEKDIYMLENMNNLSLRAYMERWR